MPNKNKEKGNLLEAIIQQFCQGIKDAKVSRNAKVYGRNSNTDREVDVFIQGQYGVFDVKIAIESKNYSEPVGIELVESFSTKIRDIGVDLGAMVCPSGFTQPAKQTADSLGIQLFEVFDTSLNNSNLLIPIRYVDPNITSYSPQFSSKALDNRMELSMDSSRWIFEIKNQNLNLGEMIDYAWNNDLIPQTKGEHLADFGVVTIKDREDKNKVYYVEFKLNIRIEEDYYLKLFPASFLKQVGTPKEHHHLFIDMYSDAKDFEKNGWKKYETMEEMNKDADIENQPEGIRELILRTHSTFISKE